MCICLLCVFTLLSSSHTSQFLPQARLLNQGKTSDSQRRTKLISITAKIWSARQIWTVVLGNLASKPNKGNTVRNEIRREGYEAKKVSVSNLVSHSDSSRKVGNTYTPTGYVGKRGRRILRKPKAQKVNKQTDLLSNTIGGFLYARLPSQRSSFLHCHFFSAQVLISSMSWVSFET